MAEAARMIEICASNALLNGGRGVRFEVSVAGRAVPAFAVRYGGVARAYLNRCAHVAMELDWQLGEFFDFDADHLVCSTHGALYDAATGKCIGGACVGYGHLRALQVKEHDGRIWWLPDDVVQAPGATAA